MFMAGAVCHTATSRSDCRYGSGFTRTPRSTPHRGVGADSRGQRDDGGDRKTRRSGQPPEGAGKPLARALTMTPSDLRSSQVSQTALFFSQCAEGIDADGAAGWKKRTESGDGRR